MMRHESQQIFKLGRQLVSEMYEVNEEKEKKHLLTTQTFIFLGSDFWKW